MVKNGKREANKKFGKRMNEDANGNMKLFWKELKKIKGSKKMECLKMKDKSGIYVDGDENVKGRWKEYFEDLLNVTEEKEVNVNMCGFEGVKRSKYLGCDEITRAEVDKAIQKLKNGKAAGVDDISAEMLKYGGESVKEWMWKVCKKAFESGKVPNDWKNAVIVPLYKGKGSSDECKNYRGISLLSVAWKVYARVLIERVWRITEGMLDEQQGGFRKGRGCVDQIFAVKQICEKAKRKKKKVFMGFMDLEKAYDSVNRKGLWQVLMMYGVSGKLLEGIKSLHDGSKACVRVNGTMSEWFEIKKWSKTGMCDVPVAV